MTRRTRGQLAEQITQADPTAPRERDAFGHEIDQWGLPLSGPIRARLLADLGKPDPNVAPAAWEGATPLRELPAGDAQVPGGDSLPPSDPDAPAGNVAEKEMNDG